MVKREIVSAILKRLIDKKILILLGPRQAGKSTLMRQLSPQFIEPVLWWNGDDADIRSILANANSGKLKTLIGGAKTLVIDEAQRIENIDLALKIIADTLPGVKVLATGSSAFELAN